MAMSTNEGQIDAVQGPAEDVDPLSEMLSDLLGSEDDSNGGDEVAVVVELTEPSESAEEIEVLVAAEMTPKTVGEESVDLESAEAEPPRIDLDTEPEPTAVSVEETFAEPQGSNGIPVEAVVVYQHAEPEEPISAVELPEEPAFLLADGVPQLEPEIDEFATLPEPPEIALERDDFEPEPVLEAAEAPALEAVISEIDRETNLAPREDFDFEAHSAEAERAPHESCIVFLLDGTGYAIPIRSVLELDAMPRITAVPNVPGFVRGITNLRGEIIPVLDLRTLLGMERNDVPQRGRILIVRTTDQLSAALAVDDVRGAASLALGELVQPASPIQGKVASVLMGVGEHQNQVLNVLDVDKLFRTPEIQQFAAN